MVDTKRIQLEDEFKKTLVHCLVLSPAAKMKWFGMASFIPDQYLKKLVKALQKQNKKTDRYIAAALTSDAGRKQMQKMKDLFHTISGKLVKLRSEEESRAAEQIFEKQIENLNNG